MDQFAADLESLGSLNREHLHVFVAGPGFGEGVAVALPGQGWLLIDSCEVRFGDIALLSVVERWRSSEEEPVEALMFTHPHQDHCEGLPLLLERLQPSRVLVAGVDSEPRALELQRRYWEHVSQESEGAEQAIGVAARVRTALKAVRTWEDLGPLARASGHDRRRVARDRRLGPESSIIKHPRSGVWTVPRPA